jgi:hypothetical protein
MKKPPVSTHARGAGAVTDFVFWKNDEMNMCITVYFFIRDICTIVE